MKAKSTIEKKELDYRKEILAIQKQWEEGNFHDELENARHKSLTSYWRALRWVLNKDEDETNLTQ